MSKTDLDVMAQRYFLAEPELHPVVYYRLTDNWVETTVRFVVPEHGIRHIRDRVSRDILDAFDRAKIQIASSTMEVTVRSESS